MTVHPPPLGICRFSFVGRGDWTAWRRGRSPDRLEIARQLYDMARMERRFWTLENLLLPSLLGQTQEEWRLVLLTSDLMPQAMQNRLRAAASDPRVEIEVSSAEDVNGAIVPVIERLGLKDAVQFRVDDDDCLARGYVARLDDVSQALYRVGSFTFSIAHGLAAAGYPGQSPKGYRMTEPFLGLGAAALLPPHQRGGMSIYSWGHFALQRRWMSVLDNGVRGRGAPGWLLTRTMGHDSAVDAANPLGPPSANEITWAEFERALAAEFPFIRPDDLRRFLASAGGEG
ncbi:MAG: glycosyltransferase [Pseudomonadota bacterium]